MRSLGFRPWRLDLRFLCVTDCDVTRCHMCAMCRTPSTGLDSSTLTLTSRVLSQTVMSYRRDVSVTLSHVCHCATVPCVSLFTGLRWLTLTLALIAKNWRLRRTLFIFFYDLDWAVRAATRNGSLSWPDKVLFSSYLWLPKRTSSSSGHNDDKRSVQVKGEAPGSHSRWRRCQ